VGDFPFKGRDINTLYKNISSQPLNLEIAELSKVSSKCKNLLNKLMEKDSELRLSSSEILEHEWFSSELDETPIVFDQDKSRQVIQNMSEYKNGSKLNKAIKMFNFRLSSSSNDIRKLRDLFLQ